MTKYIHYCWFGGKPLPKLAQKCLESWKKYLPDFEIKLWNEETSNLEECPFVKEAYENKKWAFVADYVRTKAINEYGGIYFDTDMEIIKPIDELLKQNKTFLGVEDSHLIACGVWYEPKPHSYMSQKMLEFYQSQPGFDVDNMYRISIPRIISNILTDYDSSNFDIQNLKHDITIYSRDYFYPLSYDHQYNIFTDNTCMIHYYDATWTPKFERRENKIFRILGKKNGQRFINLVRGSKKIAKKGIKAVLYPAIIYKRKKDKITKDYLNNINLTIDSLDKLNGNENYITFVNTNWLGVTNATRELFNNIIPCMEIYRKKDLNLILKKLKEKEIKEVVFSGFCIGWKDLVMLLHKNNIITKTFFHGSHSQVLEPYGWARNLEIYNLFQNGYLTQMGTCKASLINFYKNKGCDIKLLKNRVVLPDNFKYDKKKNKKLRIGIYASQTESYLKNVFSSIASLKQLNKECVIDMVPINRRAVDFATRLGIEVDGVNYHLKREELIKRIAQCDLVLYVTFSECAPMLPLESFAVKTICITGNNHHYFQNTELEKYLVVSNECSVNEIANKIKLCLDNYDKVLKLFEKWSNENNLDSIKCVNDYVKIEGDDNE